MAKFDPENLNVKRSALNVGSSGDAGRVERSGVGGRDLLRRTPLTLIALLSGALLFPTLGAGAADTTTLSPDHSLARSIFQELVEINTVRKNGATAAAQAMAARLRAAGFTDDDLTLTGPNPKSQNLVARLRGNGTNIGVKKFHDAVDLMTDLMKALTE